MGARGAAGRHRSRPSGPDRYFEHHLKLLPDTEAGLCTLAALAGAHGAHLSWNARRVRSAGRHARFVTQRCHGMGADRAAHRLTALLDAVRAGHHVLSVERGFVLYDSNPSIDDGWITRGPP